MPKEPYATAVQTAFAQDVARGLSASPKHLPSKYFYDAEGDRLFQEIMRMPEYYLTDCEYEILESAKGELLNILGNPFELVELGAGDGLKTKVLLEYFLAREAHFQYLPVDISGNVLELLEQDLKAQFPSLQVNSLQGDYFQVLGDLSARDKTRKLVLYLGSTIGNLGPERELEFLQCVNQYMNPGDLLLTGFDLKKDPEVILKAYNDPAGITAAFNLNLLDRINRELDGDFRRDQFCHWETYNPATGETRSYLVSTADQDVFIGALDRRFSFQAWEAIGVELSQKYDLPHIESLARRSHFRVKKHFFDGRRYFVDSLWEKTG